MAFKVISCPAREWTLIGEHENITFQVASSMSGIYITSTIDSTAPDPEEVGYYYKYGQGMVNKKSGDIFIAGGSYIWAKPIGGSVVRIVVEDQS